MDDLIGVEQTSPETRKLNKLKRLIREYKDASVELSWMGGSHPDTWEETEQEAKDTKRRLYNFINREL